jgi:hypothetical protein
VLDFSYSLECRFVVHGKNPCGADIVIIMLPVAL